MSNDLSPRPDSHQNTLLRVAIVPAVGMDSYLSARVLRELRRRWLLAGAIFIFAVAAGLAATFLLQPKYEAEVRFVHARGADQLGSVDRLIGQLGGIGALAGLTGAGGNGLRDEDVTLVTSGSVLRRFVEERQLTPVLFAEDWDASKGEWRSDRVQDHPTVQDAVRELQDDVLVLSDDRGTSVLTLRVRWRDALQAADWANELVRLTNSHVRERVRSEASRSLEYLNRTLDETDSVETRAAIFRLIEAQMKTMMLASVQEDYAFRVIDPAVPAEADDFVSPNRPLIAVLVGLVALLGFLLAVAWRVAIRPDAE